MLAEDFFHSSPTFTTTNSFQDNNKSNNNNHHLPTLDVTKNDEVSTTPTPNSATTLTSNSAATSGEFDTLSLNNPKNKQNDHLTTSTTITSNPPYHHGHILNQQEHSSIDANNDFLPPVPTLNPLGAMSTATTTTTISKTQINPLDVIDPLSLESYPGLLSYDDIQTNGTWVISTKHTPIITSTSSTNSHLNTANITSVNSIQSINNGIDCNHHQNQYGIPNTDSIINGSMNEGFNQQRQSSQLYQQNATAPSTINQQLDQIYVYPYIDPLVDNFVEINQEDHKDMNGKQQASQPRHLNHKMSVHNEKANYAQYLKSSEENHIKSISNELLNVDSSSLLQPISRPTSSGKVQSHHSSSSSRPSSGHLSQLATPVIEGMRQQEQNSRRQSTPLYSAPCFKTTGSHSSVSSPPEDLIASFTHDIIDRNLHENDFDVADTGNSLLLEDFRGNSMVARSMSATIANNNVSENSPSFATFNKQIMNAANFPKPIFQQTIDPSSIHPIVNHHTTRISLNGSNIVRGNPGLSKLEAHIGIEPRLTTINNMNQKNILSSITTSSSLQYQQHKPQPKKITSKSSTTAVIAAASSVSRGGTGGSMLMSSKIESFDESFRKRNQVKSACVMCRKSCKKCDHQRPCSRCIKMKMEDLCVDVPRKIRQTGSTRGPYNKKKEMHSSSPSILISQPFVQSSSVLSHSPCILPLSSHPHHHNLDINPIPNLQMESGRVTIVKNTFLPPSPTSAIENQSRQIVNATHSCTLQGSSSQHLSELSRMHRSSSSVPPSSFYHVSKTMGTVAGTTRTSVPKMRLTEDENGHASFNMDNETVVCPSTNHHDDSVCSSNQVQHQQKEKQEQQSELEIGGKGSRRRTTRNRTETDTLVTSPYPKRSSVGARRKKIHSEPCASSSYSQMDDSVSLSISNDGKRGGLVEYPNRLKECLKLDKRLSQSTSSLGIYLKKDKHNIEVPTCPSHSTSSSSDNINTNFSHNVLLNEKYTVSKRSSTRLTRKSKYITKSTTSIDNNN